MILLLRAAEESEEGGENLRWYVEARLNPPACSGATDGSSSFRVEHNTHNAPLVVEPGGHVCRPLVGLCTCPPGGFDQEDESMGIAVEALFTSALGLQPPWVV
ncbi:hypothetical protein, partial [Caldimonas thermodepolymerans]